MDVKSPEDKLVSETRGQSKYKKGGTAGVEGVLFQVDLLTVVLLNAFRNFKGWKLSTENERYGKFDDVVLELPDGAILLQAKHRKNKKLRFNELFSVDSKNSDFSLGKYFFSYQEIKSQVQVKYVVICTNSDVEADDGTRKKFFNTEKDARDSILYHSDRYSFYTFNDSILPKLEEHVTSYYVQNLKKKNAGKGEEVITLENLSDFLYHLKFYCSYPSEGRLNMFIEQMFSNVKCATNLSCETSAKYIHTKMLDWFRQPKGIHLEDCHVKAMISEIRSNKYCKELEEYNVFFDNAELVFGDTKRILHVLSNGWYLLNALKIYSALQSNEKTRTDVLYVSSADSAYIQHAVEAFELPQYTHLIIIQPKIEDYGKIRGINVKLRDILHKKPYKKVILVGDSYNRLASAISVNNDIYEATEECISFKSLSTDTQLRLLNEKINFQGKYISLKELFLIESLENCEKVLNLETMEKLIKSEKFELGSSIEFLDKHTQRYYVRRKFIKKISHSGDKDKKELIDEEKICDLEDKLIVISDSPGAGKSTVFTHLAVTMKETMPHLWVLRINLNDYSKVLKEVQKSGVREGNLLESLNVTKLRSQFERSVFSMGQRVLLMLDGVDEICPDYLELVLRLIVQCQEAPNFYKILITTRPHTAPELEEKLNVKALTLNPFRKRDQIHFLTNYWMHSFEGEEEKRKKCKHYAKALINNFIYYSWMGYNNDDKISFTAVPQQLRMLAEIFETTDQMEKPIVWSGCKQYLDAEEGEPVFPDEMNIAQLYKMFIIRKRDSFKHKGNPSGTIVADEALDKEFEESLNCHRLLALEEILGYTDCRYFSCYQDVDRNHMNTNVLKIGIIQQIGNGLHLVHRTFAEYFVAETILLELKKQQTNPDRVFQEFFIDEILYFHKFNVVRAFLSSFLQNATNSLPYDIFRNKRSFKYRINLIERLFNKYLIHELARDGCVEILRFLFRCIGFKTITDNGIKMINCNDIELPLLERKLFSVETLNYLKYITDRGGLNIQNNDSDSTPLDYAIKNNDLRMVTFLIEHGANVIDISTLWNAILCKNIDIMKILIRNVIHIVRENGCVQSITAVDKVWTTQKLLMENGSHVNAIDQVSGDTVLQTDDVNNYRLDCVKFLVRNGADVNVRCGPDSPLLVAVENNQFEIVVFLVTNGANVNITNFHGETPLHVAVENNQLEIVKFLVRNGADVNVSRNVNNETPLHLAVKVVQSNHFEIVKFLVRNGAKVNIRNRYDETALHLAGKNNQVEVVMFLMQNGAVVNNVNNESYTALDIASELDDEIIKLLKNERLSTTRKSL